MARANRKGDRHGPGRSQLHVWVPEELVDQVRSTAEREDLHVAQLIRRALRHYLNCEDSEVRTAV